MNSFPGLDKHFLSIVRNLLLKPGEPATMEKRKRTGRPLKPATPGQRVSLGLKVTPEVKQLLDRAASSNGRTQSQEAEVRLEGSFRDQDLLSQVLMLAYGPTIADFAIRLAEAMRRAGPAGARLAGSSSDAWVEIPYAFDQVALAINAIVEERRPPGDATPPAYEPLVVIGDKIPAAAAEHNTYAHLGVGIAAAITREAATGSPLMVDAESQYRARLLHQIATAARAKEQT